MTTLQAVPNTTLPTGGVDGNLLAGIRDGEWLARQTFQPLRYAVPGVVPEGLSVLAGAPKVGKSWLLLNCLLAAASGGCALGGIQMPDQRDVLYLALEDSDRRMQSRCHNLLGSEFRPDEPIPPRFQYLTQVHPNLLIATIAEWLEIYPGGFVVVDTLGKVLPPALAGETPYSRDYRIMSQLHAVASTWPGCSLLMSHHDRKAVTTDFVEAISGTNGIAGGADTVIVLTRDRNQPQGLLQVTGRDVFEAAYAVDFNGGAWTLDGGTLAGASEAAEKRRAGMGLGDRSRDIIDAVAAHHPPGATAPDIAKVTGLSEKTVGAYLSRLYGEKRLARPSRGVYTPPVGSVGFGKDEQ